MELVFEILLKVAGGLGVFLLGMKFMSEGMQAVAGDRLNRLIALVTNNRLMAVFVGMTVTSIIQSSSVTTVMVVGMVNAGLMNLMQALGVVLGANIGTTITGWILVLEVAKYGLPILGISSFFYLFTKREWLRYTAMMCVGLGMVFFGLELMKGGFGPVKQMPEFEAWFSRFQPHTYLGLLKCCAVGALLTAIVQSSSATLGITIALACKGLLTFDAAAALVVGVNVGTTITAYLACIGASASARRAAWGHIFVNVIGALWVTSIFHLYLGGVKSFLSLDAEILGNTAHPDFEKMITTAIATTHTGFNALNALLFVPFLRPFARFLESFVPDRERIEKPHLTYFDVTMLSTPALGIQQSRAEVDRMSESVEDMLVKLRTNFSGAMDKESEDSLFEEEENLDTFQSEVVEFLSKLLSGNVPHHVMEEGRSHLRMADEYESIGDYITNILKMHLKLHKADGGLSEAGSERMVEIHDNVVAYLEFVNDAMRKGPPNNFLRDSLARGDAVTRQVKEARAFHMERVGTDNTSPFQSMIYTDMLNAYRRIKDHTLNIAEVVAGEK